MLCAVRNIYAVCSVCAPENIRCILYVPKKVRYYEGLFIESWSGSAGYSAEMLTEDGKSWRVEDESTLASSVNIEAEYPALNDHEELA